MTSFAVVRNGPNTLDRATIPIIFLPGFMGTRLRLDDQDWDPNNALGLAFDWITTTSSSQRRKLDAAKPAEIIDDDNWKEHRGLQSIFESSYVSFINWLQNTLRSVAIYGNYPAYAIGYDWRQSNRVSAERVSIRINEILELEKAEKAILITHSNGGLVARAACNPSGNGLEDSIAGVIHIAQPFHGAPVLYRRFFSGAKALPSHSGFLGVNYITAGIFARVLGNTAKKFVVGSSRVTGAFQLLPTPDLRGPDGPWLKIIEKDQETDLGNGDFSYATYLTSESPPGLLSTDMKRAVKGLEGDIKRNINEAEQFYTNHGKYRHPSTYVIYGHDQETDVMVVYDHDKTKIIPRREMGQIEVPDPGPRLDAPARQAMGDSTVSSQGGAGLAPVGTAKPEDPHYENAALKNGSGSIDPIALVEADPLEKQYQLGIRKRKIDHQEICNHPLVKEFTLRAIVELVEKERKGSE